MSKSQAKSFALSTLKKYVPEGYEVVQFYENAPQKYTIGSMTINIGSSGDFMEYIDKRTKEGVLEEVSTAVHELNHGYTSVASYTLIVESKGAIPYTFGDEYLTYFINSQDKVLVRVGPTFPSKNIAKVIPKELQTFRFNTYIKGFSSTQSQGIYGLLDEMNAYRMDVKTSFLLYDYYKNELNTKGEKWLDYMQNVDGSLYAYMEFKYYILKYLIYAQAEEPEIYQGIMSNQKFKEAFLKVEKSFGELAQAYFKKRDEILAEIRKQGTRASLGEEYTSIGNKGIGNFMDVYLLLEGELKKEAYSTMMQLLKK